MTFQVRNLNVSVGNRQLLSNTDFEIASGKLTVLVGGSGSGKSTLLRVLAGLENKLDPAARVHWEGSVDWHAEGDEHSGKASNRSPRIGLVFQQPALLDELNAIQNVQLAIDHRDLANSKEKRFRKSDSSSTSDTASSPPQDHDSARWWLQHLDVPINVPISRLSGGQRQRLSLAQVLAGKPEALIYDEPTTGLDAHTAKRVARLIRQTQVEESITSIVVTHDYTSFLPIADDWLILDPIHGVVLPCSSQSIQKMLDDVVLDVPLQAKSTNSIKLMERTGKSEKRATWSNYLVKKVESLGAGVEWAGLGLIALLPRFPNLKWGIRFFAHYARLVFGGTGMIYLGLAGLIIGFVSTYFTLRYMPYKIYTEPLLMEELIGVIGFALYRILIPVLTSILVAARCSAAVSADLGNKTYGGQIESLRLLHVAPHRYLFTSVLWSFVIGTCLLNQIAFMAAKAASLAVHLALQPNLGSPYWELYFHQPLIVRDHFLYVGFWWLTLKLVLSALGTAIFTYALALRPKLAASEVSRTITTTILWCTLWVLLVHMLSAFLEFDS